MIINQDKTPMASDIQGTRKAKINVTAAGFKALYGDTYTNPIKAIIRESVSNAIDSHNKVGSDQPVVVTLPNEFNTFLTVEDSGTGIEPSMVYDLALDYFASTKQESEGDIGGFGIGFKSPFSYQGMFDVWNTWEGTTTHYKFYLDEFGIPTGGEVSKKQVDRGNGVKITVPVLPGDISKFVTEAEDTLRFFHPKPLVKGNSSYKDRSIHIGGSFGFVPNNELRTHILNVGGVGYQIRTESGTMVDRYCSYQKQRLVINCGPSDVTVPLSREVLSMDDKTKKFLAAKFSEVEGWVKQKMEESVEHIKTWKDLRGLDPEQTKQLKTFLKIGLSINIEGFNLNEKTASVDDIYTAKYCLKTITESSRTSNLPKGGVRFGILSEPVVLMVNDFKKVGVGRCREYVRGYFKDRRIFEVQDHDLDTMVNFFNSKHIMFETVSYTRLIGLGLVNLKKKDNKSKHNNTVITIRELNTRYERTRSSRVTAQSVLDGVHGGDYIIRMSMNDEIQISLFKSAVALMKYVDLPMPRFTFCNLTDAKVLKKVGVPTITVDEFIKTFSVYKAEILEMYTNKQRLRIQSNVREFKRDTLLAFAEGLNLTKREDFDIDLIDVTGDPGIEELTSNFVLTALGEKEVNDVLESLGYTDPVTMVLTAANEIGLFNRDYLTALLKMQLPEKKLKNLKTIAKSARLLGELK